MANTESGNSTKDDDSKQVSPMRYTEVDLACVRTSSVSINWLRTYAKPSSLEIKAREVERLESQREARSISIL